MKHYLSFEEFKEIILTLPDDESVRTIPCESYDGITYKARFVKYLFESDDGTMHPFVVYSLPMSTECGLIQEHGDDEWHSDILEVWGDIVSAFDMSPYVETG